MPYLDEDSPAADRQRRSTFFLFGGTLYEAFQLVEHLRPHFGTHPAWADTFGAYGSDEAIRARLERGGDLHTIRNHVAYHTARHVAGKSLERLNLDAYVFVSGRGMRSGNIYYDLADTVATHWASGAPAPGEPFLREMERVAVLTRDLALDFARRGERLIHRTLSGFGFRMEWRVGDRWETEVAPVPADAPGGPRA